LITSGDIQYGVPTKVFFLADRVPESCPETPKSASFTSPVADKRMLAATPEKFSDTALEARVVKYL
jgi:hypothetical protein